MPVFIMKILEQFLDKKRIIGWISAAVIAIGATYVGMSINDFKSAICTAPVIEAVPAK